MTKMFDVGPISIVNFIIKQGNIYNHPINNLQLQSIMLTLSSYSHAKYNQALCNDENYVAGMWGIYELPAYQDVLDWHSDSSPIKQPLEIVKFTEHKLIVKQYPNLEHNKYYDEFKNLTIDLLFYPAFYSRCLKPIITEKLFCNQKFAALAKCDNLEHLPKIPDSFLIVLWQDKRMQEAIREAHASRLIYTKQFETGLSLRMTNDPAMKGILEKAKKLGLNSKKFYQLLSQTYLAGYNHDQDAEIRNQILRQFDQLDRERSAFS